MNEKSLILAVKAGQKITMSVNTDTISLSLNPDQSIPRDKVIIEKNGEVFATCRQISYSISLFFEMFQKLIINSGLYSDIKAEIKASLDAGRPFSIPKTEKNRKIQISYNDDGILQINVGKGFQIQFIKRNDFDEAFENFIILAEKENIFLQNTPDYKNP